MRRPPKVRTHRVERVVRNDKDRTAHHHENFPIRLQDLLDDMSTHGYRVDEIKIGNHDAIIVASREEGVEPA